MSLQLMRSTGKHKPRSARTRCAWTVGLVPAKCASGTGGDTSIHLGSSWEWHGAGLGNASVRLDSCM